MYDDVLSAVLTFSLMAAGTIAVGSEMLNGHGGGAAPMKTVTLAPVMVTGHRKAWAEVVVDTDEARQKVQ